MIKYLNLLILFLLSCTLFACKSNLATLQNNQIKGSEFQVALANEYLKYAEAEAKQYDWSDSKYFAKKGIDVLKYEEIKPEKISTRKIKAEYLPAITQARKYLVSSINKDVIKNNPINVAKSIFYFDCWVEQLEETWQDSHISYCREKFYYYFDRLGKVASPPAPAMKVAQKPLIEIEPIQEEQVEQVFECNKTKCVSVDKRIIYFSFDSFTLNKRAKKVLKLLVRHINKSDKKYSITLNGYSDSIGTEEYNIRLSKKRASAIKNEMVRLGLDKDKIIIFAYGEDQGVLKTNDNIAEKENRSVTILLEM